MRQFLRRFRVALVHDFAPGVWNPSWLQGVGADVRVAVRSLLSTSTVTAVAVLSLVLGIGANAAIFSLVNSLIFRRLPVPAPERLAIISTTGVRD